MQLGRPYADNMRRVVSHLVKASPDYKHPYLTSRAVNRVGYIVVTSDRGLAGGLNINLFKKIDATRQRKKQPIRRSSFCGDWSKRRELFQNLWWYGDCSRITLWR